MVVWSSIYRLVLSAVTKLGAFASASFTVTYNRLSFYLEINVLFKPISTILTAGEDASALKIDKSKVKAYDNASFLMIIAIFWFLVVAFIQAGGFF